jgi:hypothetical protein
MPSPSKFESQTWLVSSKSFDQPKFQSEQQGGLTIAPEKKASLHKSAYKTRAQ